MVDLYSQYLRAKDQIDDAINKVLKSTAFIQGPEVDDFSRALESYTGAKFVIPCANGTDALQIAMMSLGFKRGDEVILPVHTYVATAEVIALLGLRPVFVDVDPNTFTIDVSQLRGKITQRTVAIVPVHLYGQCAEMQPILELAQEYNLSIIEDAAQSLGAMYRYRDGRTKMAGTIGTIGTTSFFPTKNLGCFGDGGALFTNDEELADKMRMISNHGQKVKYSHEIIGVNSRLDTLQAAVLKVKLTHLNDYQRRRQEAAAFYDQSLSSVAELEIPERASYSTHVFHQYTLKIRNERRDDFKAYLSDNGVPTMIYYPIPLHLQKAFRQPGIENGSFPVTEMLSRSVISLPMHSELSEEQLEFVTGRI